MTNRTKELLQQMNSLLDELIALAEVMLEHSSADAKAESIEKLQDQQQGIIDKLIVSDKSLQSLLQENHNHFEHDIANLEKKIAAFEQANAKFIANLSIRKSLIHFELEDVRKSRSAIAKMKAAYTAKKTASKPHGGSQPINTLR